MSANDAMTQQSLAREMFEFVQPIPAALELEWVKDLDYLYYFEAERILRMRELLERSGRGGNEELRILDFGYLHGLIPEFLGRAFPGARFTVFDHPESPNFKNEEYRSLIGKRSAVQLQKCDLRHLEERDGEYDVVILGEIIEHLDPTVAAEAFQDLRRLTAPGGRLLITSPNPGGLKNSVFTFLGRDAQHMPLPDATMSYGHIHLWSMPLLRGTLEHYGWTHVETAYTHGFEKWAVAKADRHWGSLKHQLLLRLIDLLATRRPRWRGQYVTLWRRSDRSPGS